MKHIEIFENERALGYNAFVDGWIPNYRYFLEKLPQILREVPNKNLLSVGCGTGNEIEQFCNDDEWQITGIDPSPEMMQQAAAKLKNYQNVQLFQGTVEQYRPSKLYGAASLLLVLHFMKDDGSKLQLLTQIAQKLEPKAPLILLDITGSKTQIKDNLNILKLLLPKDFPEVDIAKRFHRIEHELHAVSEERLSHLLHEAGFGRPCRFFQTSIYMGWMAYKR